MRKPRPPQKFLQEFQRPRQKTQIRLVAASAMGPEQQARFTVAACALLAEILRHIDQPNYSAAIVKKGERHEDK